MNKYSISAIVLFALFIIWYRGHSAYQDGYEKGRSEKYQEMLKDQREKTLDLYASNSYLSAQIEGMQNMLNEHNETIKSLESQHEKDNRKLNDAIERNKKWACAVVPSDISERLRTNSDSRETSARDRACAGASSAN